MLQIGLQYFGGRGSGGGKRTGGGSTGRSSKKFGDKGIISESEAEKVINEQVKYSLGENETYADVESVKIVSDISANGTANVEASIRTNLQIPVGYDMETGMTEYEYDHEYRTQTFRIKVKK